MRQHEPSLFVREWLERRGSLMASVTATGGLKIECDRIIPENVMEYLVETYVLCMDRAGQFIGPAVMFSRWLKNDVTSMDLQCHQRRDMAIPLGTVSIKLVLRVEKRSIVLCDIPISRDERLSAHRVSDGG
ncbi:MAG: hypothetical protein PHS79_03505 [Patescibacteria group bacterium]|nr:hypothetical protein [Patescibacteria group bacterium]